MRLAQSSMQCAEVPLEPEQTASVYCVCSLHSTYAQAASEIRLIRSLTFSCNR